MIPIWPIHIVEKPDTNPGLEHALCNVLDSSGPRPRPEQTGLKLYEVTDKTLHVEVLAVPPFPAA